jgi:hypothetical protein
MAPLISWPSVADLFSSSEVHEKSTKPSGDFSYISAIDLVVGDHNILRRNDASTPTAPLSEILSHAQILPRSTSNPGKATVSPFAIPNAAVFTLFGLIGAGFVCTGIWFFFHARNGGFHFKENDWDEYKSTVLRRRGPNGTILSGATESTDLGGGSIYKDIDSTVASSEMGETQYESKRERRSKKARMRGGDLEAGPDEDVRAYRHEKPARVGGINRQADGSSWDGSTDAHTDLLSNKQTTPTSTPTKKDRKHGIRKVSSRWNKSVREPRAERDDHIKEEARKLQEKGRAAQRRDFSYTPGEDSVADSSERRRSKRQSTSPSKRDRRESRRLPQHAESDVDSGDLGTKAYRHIIPGLSAAGSEAPSSEYAEERRKKRNGGYRRGRGDSLDE